MVKKHYNAANKKQVKEVLSAEELERVQELEDLKLLLNTKYGVRFIRRLFVKGHIFHSTFTGTSATYFQEGARSLALNVLNDVAEAAPEKLKHLILITNKNEGSA